MPTRRLVLDATDKEHFFLTLKNGQLCLGGDPGQPDMVLPGLKVMKLHCEVEVGDAPIRFARGNEPAAEFRPNQTMELGHFLIRHQGGTETTSTETSADVRKRLFVIDGADRGRSFALNDPGRTTIGNNAKAADIVLHDLYAARLHCEVHIDGDRVTVTHLVGKGGTLVNGKEVADAELKIGDVLRVGNSHMKFDVGPVDAAAKEDEESPYKAHAKPGDATAGSALHAALSPKPVSDHLMKLEGQTLGHFQIEEILGQGQAGIVFRAKDLKNGNTVALKALAPPFPEDDAELQQFGRTMKLVAPLRHPHLVGLYGAGKSGSFCWIAREYVEGESLADVMDRQVREGKFRWKNACRVGIHLALALEFLEQHEGVHGVLFPANVLIEKETKSTKLANVMLDQALAGSALADTIQAHLPPSYLNHIAPEQLDSDDEVDACSQVYSLGALLYSMVTGVPPYPGASATEILAKMKEGKPARPSQINKEVPAQFEAAILKMLARSRRERFPNAAAVLEAVEPIANMHEIAGCH